MKWGTGCFITWARRMAERDFDCFLLGTAMLSFVFPCVRRPGAGASELDVLEGAELGLGDPLSLLAVAGGQVPVAAADGADAGAVLAADRADGDGQQDLVSQLGAEIDLPVAERQHVAIVLLGLVV